jgi:hypothetical protein
LGYVAAAGMQARLLIFVFVSLLLGLSFTFYSGSVEAWFVDALKAVGFEAALDQVFARGAMISGAAMLVGTVGGGLLGQLDLAIPYLTRAAFLILLTIFAYFTMRSV